VGNKVKRMPSGNKVNGKNGAELTIGRGGGGR
jgi:hypothetical protein